MAVNKKIPQRQCVGCGEFKDKKSMIRVIKTIQARKMAVVHISVRQPVVLPKL